MIITCEIHDDWKLSDEDDDYKNQRHHHHPNHYMIIITIMIIMITTCEIDDDCNLSENRGWGDISVPHGGGSHYQKPEQVFRSVLAMLYWSVITIRIKGSVIKIQIAWRIKYNLIKDETTKESPPYAVEKVPAVVARQQISVEVIDFNHFVKNNSQHADF